MPQITFRGKIYNSEFEMPQDIRRAYRDYLLKEASTKSLTDALDITTDVQEGYRRALSKAKSSTSFPYNNNLPTIEELYRRSAPQVTTHLPSDKSLLPPAPLVIDPEHSTVKSKPSHWILKALFVILWALFAVALIYLVTQRLW
jgi:hypothetical protein